MSYLPLQPCLNCNHRVRKPISGLCWKCHALPSVRKRFPMHKRDGPLMLMEHVTELRPGSPSKVLLLAQRAADHEPLWQAGDLTVEGMED